MTNVDDELKKALRRQEPPPGFAERVLQRAGSRDPRRTWRLGRLAAAAVLVAAVGAGGVALQSIRAVRAERAAGEAARDQVMLGLQIAGSKLQLVQMKVNRVQTTRETNRNQ